MASEYIVTDRTTATKYSIQVADGELVWTSTASAASSEPIVQDTVNSSDNWTIFIDDGQLGWESTVTEQDDSILRVDTVTSTTYRIRIGDGQLFWAAVGQSRPQHSIIVLRSFRSVKSTRTYRVIK